MRDPARPGMVTKLAFGLGAVCETISVASVAGFALFYYNQVLGLSATLAGLAMSVSIVFDGLVDPFVGSLSDRTRSRLGRRHPFMFAAPVPVALSLWAVFNPPAQLEGLWLFAWFLAFTVSLRFTMSVFQVPHLALGGELSSDYAERTRVMSYANLLGAVGTVATPFVALSFFLHATSEYPRGILNPDGYGPWSTVMALVVLTCMLVSAGVTARQIPQLPKPAADVKPFGPMDFVRDIRSALTNRNYIALLLGVFFISIILGMRAGFNLYVNTYYWGLASEQVRWFAFTVLAGFGVGFLMTSRLHDRWDKRRAMVWGAVLLGVFPAVPLTLGILGLAPSLESGWLMPMLMFFGALAAAAGSVLAISVLSALADIADENELRHGLRQEGVLYSTRAVFAKLDAALGTLLVGVVLDLVGMPEKAVPGQVPQAVLNQIALVDGPLLIIPALIGAYFYGRYGIDRAGHARIKADLADARARRTSPSEAPLDVPVGV